MNEYSYARWSPGAFVCICIGAVLAIFTGFAPAI
jgi:hypothetical protein